MASICRICATLKKIENFVHLMDKELDLCNKLEKCCQIIIPENDSLPQNVCQECVSGLNECWKFSENARDAQETLQKLFCPESDSQSNNDKNLRKKLSQNQRQTNKSASPTVEVKNEAPETKTAPTFKHNVEHFTPDIDLEEVEDVSAGFQEERLEDDGATGDDDQNDDVVSSEDESQTQMLISAEILNDTAEVGEIEEREDFEDNQAQETKDRICKVQSNPSQDSGEPQTWSTYPWECRDCSIRLPSSIHLREHALAEHSEGNDMKYYCVDCTKTFSKYYTFINHVKTRHRQSLMNCCDICSTFCEDVESLVVHRATHNDQEHLHLCVICGKGFKKAVGLQLHMNCHQPDSVKYKWECEDCGKKFGTRPNLRAHQKIHLGLKEFVCDQCGKSFVQKANLEEHLLTHVNDKLIECPECGKTNISECVQEDNTTNIISPLLPFQKLVDSSESIKKDVKFLKTQWTKTNFCLQKIYGVLCAINKSQSITQTFSPVIYQNPSKEMEKDLLKEEFPLTTDDEVNSCEKKINQNEEYKADLIDVLTKIFGTKGDENGNKLSFKVVDRMFTKQVLTNYSWTGISKDKNSPKKPFNCFHGLIDVIFRVVRLADNRWTLQNTENCLRDHILKQAKKRHSRHEEKVRKKAKIEDPPNFLLTDVSSQYQENFEYANTNIVVKNEPTDQDDIRIVFT